MQIVTRKVKSLLKKVENTETAERFDVFMYDVLKSFLTGNLSQEQCSIVTALLLKEGYLE